MIDALISGKRPGAGRPASEPTKTCRVPLGVLPLIEQYKRGEFESVINGNQTELEVLRAEVERLRGELAEQIAKTDVLERQKEQDRIDYVNRIKQLETVNKSLSTKLNNLKNKQHAEP